MKVRIIAVGQKMPKWVQQGVDEYVKRMPSEMSVSFVEIAPGNRGKGADLARAIAKEGEATLAAIGKNDWVVALDVLGKALSTEQMAGQITDWQMNGHNVSILIGGPDGLAAPCLARANQKWSLSALTYPHPLVRIVIAEQLYRAWSFSKGHPYHRQG